RRWVLLFIVFGPLSLASSSTTFGLLGLVSLLKTISSILLALFLARHYITLLV
ncbi:9517_t:CDS:2, partial [Dentiscutata heterogama]